MTSANISGRHAKLKEISKKEQVNIDSMSGKDFMKKHRFDLASGNEED